MNIATAGLLLFSIALSTAAQILLKVGMSGLRGGPAAGPAAALMQAAFSPWVIGGLTAYVASAVVWLLVLSKVDVSRAYPCVALGFALTVVAGHFLLGEPVGLMRVLGVAVIMGGVALVAVS
jgi:multidrug transporter EmrE-like cation transporter